VQLKVPAAVIIFVFFFSFAFLVLSVNILWLHCGGREMGAEHSCTVSLTDDQDLDDIEARFQALNKGRN